MPATTDSDSEWIEARLAGARATVVALETAINALTVDGVASYTIDTGQTRQTVTRQNVAELRNSLSAAENRLTVLEARYCRGGRFQAKPGF